MDGRKFVVGNVGPIGCIPYQKTINQLSENQCVEMPNKLAVQFNRRLKDLITELNDNLPGSKFIHANVYDLVMEVITNYDKYGKCLHCLMFLCWLKLFYLLVVHRFYLCCWFITVSWVEKVLIIKSLLLQKSELNTSFSETENFNNDLVI